MVVKAVIRTADRSQIHLCVNKEFQDIQYYYNFQVNGEYCSGLLKEFSIEKQV